MHPSLARNKCLHRALDSQNALSVRLLPQAQMG